MNNLRLNKILAFSAFIAELIIFFALFGNIRNLFINNTLAQKPSLSYLLILLAFVLMLFLFILLIIIVNNKQSDEIDYKSKLIIEDENSKEIIKEDFDYNKDEIDIESIVKKILPKDESKFTLEKYTEKILSNIAKEFDIVQGLFFVKDKKSDVFNVTGKYAYFGEEEPKSFKLGESLSGQVAKNKTILNLKEIPDHYVTILSGLGSSTPNHLLIVPIIINDETIGIVEIASFKNFKRNYKEFFEVLSEQLGQAITKF